MGKIKAHRVAVRWALFEREVCGLPLKSVLTFAATRKNYKHKGTPLNDRQEKRI